MSQEELHEKVIVCRTSFSFDLSSGNKTADVKATIASHSKNLNNGSACFELTGTDLVVNENEILTNNQEKMSMDDCIESLPSTESYEGKGYRNIAVLSFNMLFDSSLHSSSSAPVVRVSNEVLQLQQTVLKGQCLSYILKTEPVSALGKVLLKSVMHHLALAEYWLLRKLTDKSIKGNLDTLNVLPYKSGHLFSLLIPTDAKEEDLKAYREKVNATFLLPTNAPFFRRINSYEFYNDKICSHLYNTHVGLATPYVDGLTSITKGIYSYHHYMQDKFNDNKWGCAYRSLQTIISWFRHQGYTDKVIPTHKQIQECLVKLGDKPASFIGSSQWIGSTEVGFVLESYLGVTSRFISVPSGDDLAEKGRELVHHFNTQGTPIMIGGGVLAHTILGVSWNPDSGDIRYLILDPHYTGGEDINIIQKQGWCGWKEQKFWNSKAYYNLCLPIRPSVV